MKGGERGAAAERAQSEVLGTVLLLGLTVAVVGTTVALGGAALDDTQRTADLQRVEGAMTQVDSKASLVAHGGSPSQRVSFGGSRGDLRVDDGAGKMAIEVETEGGTYTNETTLGAIVYERGDDVVAYQGGGVWRANADSAWMVSPPEFHYRGDTLTLPLVTVTGEERLTDSATIEKGTERSAGLFESENLSNPLLGGNVTITVESEYAEGWERFFESRTGANVTRLSTDTVEVRLRTETVHPTLSTSASAVGGADIAAGGIRRIDADSYNSSSGVYGPGNINDNAIFRTNGGFGRGEGGIGRMEEIRIRGDLLMGADDFPSGQFRKKVNVSGETRTNVDFVSLNPVSGAIRQRIDGVGDTDMDSETDEFTFGGGTENVTANTHVTDSLEVSDGNTLTVESGATLNISGNLDVEDGGSLVLDTDGGEVNVLADGDLDVSGTSTVRAIGGGRANLYVDGEITLQTDGAGGDAGSITTAQNTTRLDVYNTGDVTLDDGANVTAYRDRTENLWLYSSGGVVDVDGDDDRVHFTGVLYAPESRLILEDSMTFKGSFTADTFEFDEGRLRLHYDEALRDSKPFEGDSVPVVSHLHVSTHRVVIDSD
ncbi:hypothetical protein C463_07337 [Halorubrum californiense DSM 19288]|uniref:DUF7305 domain-containing protein n=1 Tax=Halorubrum californiense DSM 19288 TaxID=1227465 RepID=M0EAF8_9EURY|nr:MULTISPECIES: hypothetical protein [Halorubrum]ELZ44750.1 hypothetical protein C463_07337 [Halorubrum californiense DSM 19288]TKX71787.1 hypothetical protein EXE40_06880 [Halorubrum sp. GN11GM_10-3_MGM]